MDFWRFDRTGLDPSTLVSGDYDVRLVFLSFLVATVASYAALEVIERVTAASTKRVRWVWLTVGSFAMGLGVWAMHFIGMLSCKKIRDEDGSWTGLEAYIGSRSGAQFTHGICGQCEGEM